VTAASVLSKAQAETRPCVVVGCPDLLPVRVSCVPRFDGRYDVLVAVDQEAVLAHLVNMHGSRARLRQATS
jgi:hypothetical protein